MNNIGHLYQVLQSLNGGIASMRTDFEHLKVEVNSLKSKQEPSSSVSADTTTSLITDLTSKVDGLEESIKHSNMKVEQIENTLSITSSNLSSLQADIQKIMKDKKQDIVTPSITKDEVQTLIDQSIAILLGGLRPVGEQVMQDNPVFAPLTSIDEVDENSLTLRVKNEETMNGDDVVVEPPVMTTTIVETPKPKGRGGRKKKVTATATA